MTTMISRRSLYGFYITLFLFCLFYFLMLLAIGGMFIHLYKSNEFETRNYGAIPMCMLVLIAAIYTVYKFFKNAPAIEINNESISFNGSSIYFWKDLEKIELTGKRPYLFWTDAEGVLLKFKGMKERIFLDKMYKNVAEIKWFIQHQIIEKEPAEMLLIDKVKLGEVVSESFVYYKGYQFFCINGFGVWIFGSFFMYVAAVGIIRPGSREITAPVTLLAALLFLFLSARIYYFGLSDNYLIVRNHNFFG